MNRQTGADFVSWQERSDSLCCIELLPNPLVTKVWVRGMTANIRSIHF
jgi:hypothetical protein